MESFAVVFLLSIVGIQWVLLRHILKLMNSVDSWFPAYGAKDFLQGPAIGEELLPNQNVSVPKEPFLALFVYEDSKITRTAVQALLTVQQDNNIPFAIVGMRNPEEVQNLSGGKYVDLPETEQTAKSISIRPFLFYCQDGKVVRKGLVNHLEHAESVVYHI